jgi:HSP20 family protein
MWADACAMIERAEQMHRQFFQPAAAEPRACWEPPIDVFESEHDLSIVVALPGVDPQDIEISSELDVLRVAGIRRSPPIARGSAVHRLEIPYGRFERRIRLPAARWELTRSTFANGCLLLNLLKQA